MKLKNLLPASLFLILGLLVAIGPFTFAAVCPAGEMVMKCHWTGRVELYLGIALAVLALLKLLPFSADFSLGLDFAILLNGLGIALVPEVLIGVCKKATMHCHLVTKPFLLAAASLVIFIALVEIVLLLLKKRKAK